MRHLEYNLKALDRLAPFEYHKYLLLRQQQCLRIHIHPSSLPTSLLQCSILCPKKFCHIQQQLHHDQDQFHKIHCQGNHLNRIKRQISQLKLLLRLDLQQSLLSKPRCYQIRQQLHPCHLLHPLIYHKRKFSQLLYMDSFYQSQVDYV